MKLNDIYLNAVRTLDESNIENASFEVKELIKHLLKLSETEFLLKRFDDFDDAFVNELNESLIRRISGEPVQYIIGEWDFMGNTYKVGEGVLIPRPETELLCQYVIDELKCSGKSVIYDLCSGSGCIAISLKLFLPQSDVFAVEKSGKAFEYLRYNNEALCGKNAVNALNGDIFDIESYYKLPLADVIVSNPPYIKKSEIPSLQSEVLREPEMALDGGDDGLDFYRFIISEWKARLKPDGFFAFECGEDQSDDITDILNLNGFDSTVIKDYNDINRIVIGRRKN